MGELIRRGNKDTMIKTDMETSAVITYPDQSNNCPRDCEDV